VDGGQGEAGSTALTVSGAGQVVLASDYTGAGRLANLSWRGMDYGVQAGADTAVHEGWHGVARGFEGEGDGDRGVEVAPGQADGDADPDPSEAGKPAGEVLPSS